jgi:N-dimethylarginine dimethylaminohydrolase
VDKARGDCSKCRALQLRPSEGKALSNTVTRQSEIASLKRVIVRSPLDACIDQANIEAQWERLNYRSPPNLDRAIAEFDSFLKLVTSEGAEVIHAGPGEGLSMDAAYVRDASIVCDRGAILCRMGKEARSGEPANLGLVYERLGIPVIGAIQGEGRLEGGDFLWLTPTVAAVGEGYRTNPEGIKQLRELLGDSVDELITVALPHYRGPEDVFHLMSIISPLDDDLALVYSPLMPVRFRKLLIERGFELVEVPAQEFNDIAGNVLAIAPRKVVMVAGNPETARRLVAAGVDVLEYTGFEISTKGDGGPTCLTRPLERSA